MLSKKYFCYLVLFMATALLSVVARRNLLVGVISKATSPMTIYGFTAKDIDGQEFSMSDYKGRVVVIVNVATA